MREKIGAVFLACEQVWFWTLFDIAMHKENSVAGCCRGSFRIWHCDVWTSSALKDWKIAITVLRSRASVNCFFSFARAVPFFAWKSVWNNTVAVENFRKEIFSELDLETVKLLLHCKLLYVWVVWVYPELNSRCAKSSRTCYRVLRTVCKFWLTVFLCVRWVYSFRKYENILQSATLSAGKLNLWVGSFSDSLVLVIFITDAENQVDGCLAC